MFFVPLMFLNQNRLMNLENQAKLITIRGYDDRYEPEADLQRYRIGVHLLADYCPTDRYIYISKKIRPELKSTWKGFQGKIIEETYFEFYDLAKTYIQETDLRNLDFNSLKTNISRIIESKEQKINDAVDLFSRKPRTRDKTRFLEKLKILVDFEFNLFSTYMQFLISKKSGINKKTEFQTVFDFIFEHSMDGRKIGLTDSLRPDFIYIRKVMGDIKTGKWEEFFRVMIAAYSLAYEASEKSDMNYGVVLNPTFIGGRKVPTYMNSEIFVVSDVLRKAFLAKRNKKLKVLLLDDIPQKPANDVQCQDCGYWEFCWGED